MPHSAKHEQIRGDLHRPHSSTSTTSLETKEDAVVEEKEEPITASMEKEKARSDASTAAELSTLGEPSCYLAYSYMGQSMDEASRAKLEDEEKEDPPC